MKHKYYHTSDDLLYLFRVFISNFGRSVECSGSKGKYRLTDITSGRIKSVTEVRLKFLLEHLYKKLSLWGYFEVLMGLSDSSEIFDLALSLLSSEDRKFLINTFRRFACKLNYSDMIISDSVNGLRRNTLWLKLFEIT